LPTAIAVLTDRITLEKETAATFEFAVEPADADVDLVIGGNDANPQLRLAETSHETKPLPYELAAVRPAAAEDGQPTAGRYTATVRDRGGSENYDDRVVLALTTKNEAGEPLVLISSVMKISRSTEPELLSVRVGDAEAVRTADDVFEIKLPCGMDLTAVTPELTTNGAEVVGGHVPLDLSMPATVALASASGASKTYRIVAHFSDLPVVYLRTPAPIVSKEEWVAGCNIQIWNAGQYNAEYEHANLKGRGNSTWYGQEKRPYAVKLDTKAEVLGMPRHKRWVLLANYFDRSHLRTDIAFHLGTLSRLDYTPRIRSVEIVLNGAYRGLYQVTEQLKADENRVAVGPGGFLLEVDVLDPAGEVTFTIPSIEAYAHINIKEPDMTAGSPEYDYVRQFVTEFDNVLHGDNFADPQNGYPRYIDTASFVDWYLINEIVKNQDSNFYSSCFMHFVRGGRIGMGPLWDFDRSIGNRLHSPDDAFYWSETGWLTKEGAWMSRLFEDPGFRALVKERFRYFYGKLPEIRQYIARRDRFLSEAKANDTSLYGSEEGAGGEYLSAWLERRMEWLKAEFERM